MTIASPYLGLAPSQWRARTQELLADYPLKSAEIVDATLKAWESIFASSLGGFHIGINIFPKPQIMGFFLHELIPLELSARYPGLWREDRRAGEKDIVYISNPALSAEIKTSSNPNRIFGNRSYAQEGETGRSKKDKSGYYIAVNFEQFSFTKENEPIATIRPRILKIRFGWLDHNDWTGQAAQTGQQASLSAEVESGKLLVLYPTPEGSQLSLP